LKSGTTFSAPGLLCDAQTASSRARLIPGRHAAREGATGLGGEPHEFEIVRRPFLLKPGRRYEESVKLFGPYDRVKESKLGGPLLPVLHLVKEGVEAGGKRKTFIYVNNRLEGNALEPSAR